MIYLDSNKAGIPDNRLFYPVDLVIFKAVPNCQGKGIFNRSLEFLWYEADHSPKVALQPDYLGAHKKCFSVAKFFLLK